ncbi:MAG: flavodoxin family protein [Candidatus Bathyarchaeota archaeon]|nr:MAG: flavodoxin family protein [Candidatus Bathyarchaeota archaeon]
MNERRYRTGRGVSGIKTLVVEASPRREGNSITIARSFMRGLRDGGETEIKERFLNDMEVRPCLGCWKCLEMREPGCVIDDDMTEVYPELMEADLIIFATPIYWWHIAGQMKVFLDRMEGLLAGNGPNNLSGKALVLIVTHLVEDPDGVELAIRTFRSITGWAGMSLDVIRYYSADDHVSEREEKLDEAYRLGRSYAGWEAPELIFKCMVENCVGMFSSVESLARHLAAAAGLNHRTWRSDHGLQDRGMADDELWNQIASILKDESTPKDR